jgi:hypothetical protein
MNFFVGLAIVNSIALILVHLTKYYKEPLRCKGPPPRRFFGLFSVRDVIITSISGGLVAYFSDTHFLYGVLGEFILGQFVHLLFGARTKILYVFGLCPNPNGTGYLAAPISLDSEEQSKADAPAEHLKNYVDTIKRFLFRG